MSALLALVGQTAAQVPERIRYRIGRTREALSNAQLRQFLGPAVRWTFLSRDSILVDDSLVDKILSLLGSRAHEVHRSPARSHSLVATALSAATRAGSIQDQLIDWCECFGSGTNFSMSRKRLRAW